MGNLLLLYDTTEKDLARDLKDFLKEVYLGEVVMIPLSADKGFTLQGKEEHYMNDCEGAVFLLTVGCQRFGQPYPSPSVTLEMGQTKTKFQNQPNKVIYLKEEDCNMPAIDQATYIQFNRNKIRTILEALTQVIRNLKGSGLVGINPAPPKVKSDQPQIKIEDFLAGLSDLEKQVLLEISQEPSGVVDDQKLMTVLRSDVQPYGKFKLSIQEINLLKRNLIQHQVVTSQTVPGMPYSYWLLTSLGWDSVAYLVRKQEEEQSGLLSRYLRETFSQGQKQKNDK